MRKRENFIHIYLPQELKDWLAMQSQTQTDLVIAGLKLISKVDLKTIEDIADEHKVQPGLLVDAAVLYFSRLDLPEQKDKLIDYLEIMRQQALEREKKENREG